VGGSRDSVVQDFTQMLYFYSRPLFGGDRFTDSDDMLPHVGGFPPVGAGESPDRAMDAALRNVPLPDGLMVRMSMLAVTLPDDATDQVR
jgi:hypothetical protein